MVQISGGLPPGEWPVLVPDGLPWGQGGRLLKQLLKRRGGGVLDQNDPKSSPNLGHSLVCLMEIYTCLMQLTDITV